MFKLIVLTFVTFVAFSCKKVVEGTTRRVVDRDRIAEQLAK